MDFWKLMDILHSRERIMNPLREQKFTRFSENLRLSRKSRVLDIGCGKGEFLFKLYEIYKISGVGVDLSPYCIKYCKHEKEARAPDSEIEFLIMDGKDYKTDEDFDVTSCMGASWIWDGIRGTLDTLKSMTKSEGIVILGEPYWKQRPAEEYLEREKLEIDSFHTHKENIRIGEELGLQCLYTMASDLEDWDHYETSHWWAANDYCINNPNDPDLIDLREYVDKNKETYLSYGRKTLGWCLYVYRNH